MTPWSKIKRGLLRGRHYADDSIPKLDEISKLVEYPDRRMKVIIYTMASSGIRLGAWEYLKWGHIRPIIRRIKGHGSVKFTLPSCLKSR